MAIHFCILSEQPAPNFTPLLDSRFKASCVYFLVTSQMLGRYQQLTDLLTPRGIQCEKIDVPNPMNLNAIQQSVEVALNALGSNNNTLPVFLNATGGTKPMSIGAYLAFYNASLPIFYVQSDHMHWLGDVPQGYDASYDIDNRLRIKDYLKLQGAQVIYEGDVQTLPKYQALTREFIKLSLKYANDLTLLNYLAYRAKGERGGLVNVTLSDGDLNRQGLQFLLDVCEQQDLLTVSGRQLVFNNEDSRFFCNGGWLEHYIHGAIKKISQQHPDKIQDVVRSVEFKINGSHHEMDVMALVDNNVVAFECKTKKDSAKEQDMRAQIHRLNTICQDLGGPFAKGALVTAHQPRDADLNRIESQKNRLIISGQSLQNIEPTLVSFLFKRK